MSRRIALWVLLLGGLFAVGVNVSPAVAACTGGSTLYGYYGMQVSGSTAASQPKFLNGVLYFNGACALTGSVTIGENNSVNSFASVTGSYNTNADSTITLTLSVPGNPTPETYNIGVSHIFNEGIGIETDGSAVASIDFKPQNFPLTGPHNVYNNSSLKGTWIASCSGTGASTLLSDLNYFTFDGAGNLINGIDDYNNYAQYGNQSYYGYYGVNSNGTFGGYVVLSGGSEYGFSGVLDNSLSEIQFTYSTAGATGSDILACTAKKLSL